MKLKGLVMRRFETFVLVPNFSVKEAASRLFVPPPDRRFVKEIAGAGYKLVILAFQRERDDDFSGGRIDTISGLDVLAVRVNSVGGRFRRAVDYASVLLLSIRALVLRRSFFYLYFPGTVNILVGLLCVAAGKKYGLYVRGLWKRTGIFGALNRLIIAKAEFVFTTGYGFCDLIRRNNQMVMPVVPMIAFGANDVQGQGTAFATPVVRMLFVGHIKESKGVLDCVRAVKLISEKGINVSLRIVGGGNKDDVDRLENLIESFGLVREVTFIGQINDRSELVRNFEEADIFVYPSYYPEGFPRVVYEAMLHGIVVLCTILPGMKGFMIDGKNCLEVLPRNPESIRDSFERILGDRKLAERIGSDARVTVSDYLRSFKYSSHSAQVLERLRVCNG